MSEAIALLGRTWLIGIAVAAPVGAMGVLCVQRTLSSGWRAGMTTGLGIATADALYAGLAAFGVAAVSSAMVSLQTPLRLAGGALLVYLGLTSALRGGVGESVPAGQAAAVDHRSQYFGAVGLTLTNPMTIMAFGAIFATAGLAAQPGPASAAFVTLGVAVGSLTWWLVLVTGVSAARRALPDSAVAWIRRGSGLLIAGLGAAALVSAL